MFPEKANEAADWLSQASFLMPNWKWIALISTLLMSLVIRSLTELILSRLKQTLLERKNFNKFVLNLARQQIHTPLAWILALLFLSFGIEMINLHPGFTKVTHLGLKLIGLIFLIRSLYLVVEAFGLTLEDHVKKTENTLDDDLAPFATKSLKIIVVLFGVLLSIQSFGFNVGAILAGLGIGSLAFALAAQDMAANLFGSITIITDRPFQRGDHIKIGDTEGVVEDVGFRSTRIRTFYKSLVSIPNSTVAKEKIDNLGLRPARRIQHTLGIAYDTPIEKIKLFIDRIRYLLNQHPELIPNEQNVAFQALGDFDLKILVNCFVETSERVKELEVQQDILLEILKAAKELGVEFAYPTQTLHLVKQKELS